jgi:SAM-dependent methyltransferase
VKSGGAQFIGATMHQHSLDSMAQFRSRYLDARRQEPLTVIDLGSADLNGSYRELFAMPPWRYLGVDLVAGENVDIVLRDPYRWREIRSESVDVVVSGQTFEHTEFFWETMLEIARVLKPRGMCCIIAPSCGPEHRFSRDCWRIFADGFSAVARYAGLEVVDVQTQWEDLPDYDLESNKWHDSVLIARKPVLSFGTKLRWQIHACLRRLVPPPAPAPETIIQIFHSQDGSHSEANSVTTRIGHEVWKDVSIALPRGAGAAPLRIDFMSDQMVIDVASIEVATKASTLFRANDLESFKGIVLAGDARPIAHPEYFRFRVTGIDPQLILPRLPPPPPDDTIEVRLRVRVTAPDRSNAPEKKNAAP